ncbi:trichohyalin isoform X2 [Larimichthys crocea]|nr:trichohyalin isoform X2 [Larimichthys crocea]
MTLKELSDHEALQQLTSLHTEAKKEKEEVEAKVKLMEEEINSFKNKWLAAQSRNQQLEEEVRESTQELSECRRQVDRNISSVEDILYRQRQETAARISAMDHYWSEVVRVREEGAVRESEQKSQRISQLEEEVAEKGRLIHSLTNNTMNTKSDFHQHGKRWESQLNTLEEKYRRALSKQEEGWQKRVQEMERTNELERTWLQKEGEWRQRTDTLQDEIQRLNKELQGPGSKKKKRKQWWKRRWKLRRRRWCIKTADSSEETAPLLS